MNREFLKRYMPSAQSLEGRVERGRWDAEDDGDEHVHRRSAADRDRLKFRDRSEGTLTTHLDDNVLDDRLSLLGREFMRDCPARCPRRDSS